MANQHTKKKEAGEHAKPIQANVLKAHENFVEAAIRAKLALEEMRAADKHEKEMRTAFNLCADEFDKVCHS